MELKTKEKNKSSSKKLKCKQSKILNILFSSSLILYAYLIIADLFSQLLTEFNKREQFYPCL